MEPKVFIVGLENIAQAIGVSLSMARSLKKNDKLPVFRIRNQGPWIARPDDLAEWGKQISTRHLPQQKYPR